MVPLQALLCFSDSLCDLDNPIYICLKTSDVVELVYLYVCFNQNGETSKTVSLTILDDVQAEDDEEVFLYLIPRTDGVRVAEPSRDNGRSVRNCLHYDYHIINCFKVH